MPGAAGGARLGSRGLVFALAAALALPSSIGAQSVPAFSGRYRLLVTPSPSCGASMQVGPVSVVVNVAEAAVTSGAEVSGQSAASYEVPDNGRFVLYRQGTRVHGALGASSQYLGLDSEGVYRIWMQVMMDGTAVVASGGRARASGTAFGEVELSLKSDPTGAPIPNGNCGFTTAGHPWSLEPA